MVFCFVQKFFFRQHESKARNFFPEFNIRLYDKSHYFFFLHQNQNIFFSNIGNQNIILEKKHNPPFKLNGRSLTYMNIKYNVILTINKSRLIALSLPSWS